MNVLVGFQDELCKLAGVPWTKVRPPEISRAPVRVNQGYDWKKFQSKYKQESQQASDMRIERRQKSQDSFGAKPKVKKWIPAPPASTKKGRRGRGRRDRVRTGVNASGPPQMPTRRYTNTYSVPKEQGWWERKPTVGVAGMRRSITQTPIKWSKPEQSQINKRNAYYKGKPGYKFDTGRRMWVPGKEIAKKPKSAPTTALK